MPRQARQPMNAQQRVNQNRANGNIRSAYAPSKNPMRGAAREGGFNIPAIQAKANNGR